MAKRSRHAMKLRSSDANVQPLFGDAADWSPLEEDRERSYTRKIRPQSANELVVIEAIQNHNVALALGPAGTGKA